MARFVYATMASLTLSDGYRVVVDGQPGPTGNYGAGCTIAAARPTKT
jgi:hypothetical protein